VHTAQDKLIDKKGKFTHAEIAESKLGLKKEKLIKQSSLASHP
jgi:hypothetical protein